MKTKLTFLLSFTLKCYLPFLTIIFLLFTAQPSHAFLGKIIYKTAAKIFSYKVSDVDVFFVFLGSKALRKNIKFKCLNGEWKVVLGDKAFVYNLPDSSSDVLGRYDPEERICIKAQTMGWGKTPFGWLEKKHFQ
jgi:hypothetical protein